jgi:hypothetical protein
VFTAQYELDLSIQASFRLNLFFKRLRHFCVKLQNFSRHCGIQYPCTVHTPIYHMSLTVNPHMFDDDSVYHCQMMGGMTTTVFSLNTNRVVFYRVAILNLQEFKN